MSSLYKFIPNRSTALRQELTEAYQEASAFLKENPLDLQVPRARELFKMLLEYQGSSGGEASYILNQAKRTGMQVAYTNAVLPIVLPALDSCATRLRLAALAVLPLIQGRHPGYDCDVFNLAAAVFLLRDLAKTKRFLLVLQNELRDNVPSSAFSAPLNDLLKDVLPELTEGLSVGNAKYADPQWGFHN